MSWDSVFVPADNLLLSMGVGPSEGVDLQYQFSTFLSSWQKGEPCWRQELRRCGVHGGKMLCPPHMPLPACLRSTTACL